MLSCHQPSRVGSQQDSLREIGLRDADDHEIFAKARSAEAVVMTKDRDFLHLPFEPGPPHQVIWLRVGNSSNQALQAVLLRTLEAAVASVGEGEPWVEIRSPR
jgi:predicted nuclease of predicted toxin-antitoxin system